MYASRSDRRIFFDAVMAPERASSPARNESTVVLALHGGPGFAHDYLMPGLSLLAQQVRVFVVDLPGGGRSSRHLGSGYPLSEYVADVDAVRSAIGAKKLVLLGHAWGSLLAVEYALVHPDVVDRMILVNPLRLLRAEAQDTQAQARAIDATDPGVREAYLELWPLIERAIAGEGHCWAEVDASPIWARMFGTQFATPPSPACKAAIQRMQWGVEAYFAHKGAVMLAEGQEHPLASYDLAERVALLNTPIQIIASDSDANYVAPARIHALPIEQSARRAQLTMLPGRGHFPFAENPEEFSRLVTGYLKQEVDT